MSRFRAYFYDERGKELADSRFNGKEWCATGSGIKLRNGEYDKRGRTTVTVKTRDPKDVEHIYWNGRDKPPTGSIKGNYVVTMDDFPGHRKVGVKVWAPGGAIEKFWLISEDQRKAIEEGASLRAGRVTAGLMMQPRVTKDTAARISKILKDNKIKANVRLFNTSVRVVVLGAREDADRTVNLLTEAGFSGVIGQKIDYSWHIEGRYQFFIYEKPVPYTKTTAATAEEKRARYKELMQRFKELNHKSKLLLSQKLRAKDDAKREAVQKERDANDKALHDVLEEMRALTRRTKSTEAKLNAYANLVMAYDPNQPRDQEGSDRGQWVKRKGMSISGGEPTGGTAATYNAQEKRWEAKGISDVRIKSLGIPPAWQKVRINPDENADLQVLGLDAKGRTQYLYSEAFSKSQTAAKFERVIGLRQKIDDLEKATVKDIGAGNDTAAAVRLMHLTGMRPGSDADTGAEKKAHGATNLLKEHVKVSGDTVHYDFIGKKGINIKGAVKDKLLAKHISRRLATDDGVRLFKTDGGKVNDYIKAKAGSDYKVKDLRTLKATSMAANLVKSMERPKTVREFNAARNAIGDRVSAQLGNTRSMALKAYINPIVFKGWEPQQ